MSWMVNLGGVDATVLTTHFPKHLALGLLAMYNAYYDNILNSLHCATCALDSYNKCYFPIEFIVPMCVCVIIIIN